MKFLLDTNAVIAILKGHERFLGRLRHHQPQDFGLSSVVSHELFYGAYKSRHMDENLRRIEGLQFETVAFDREDALCAGELRPQLAITGTPIGPYDVLIAGQALARGLVVVTRNTREFSRIEGLSVEDWEG